MRPTLFVILASLLIPIIPFAIVGELPGDRWLSDVDENAWLFGVSGAALLTADVFLPVPSTIIGTLLGARLGLLQGWLWGSLGLVLGNLLGYGAGRLLFLRPSVDFPVGPTGLLLFATRPVPILAEAVAIAAGAGRMRLRHFFGAAVAGNLVFSAAMAGNGAALLPEAWAGPGLVLPMMLPVAAWGAWIVYARRNRASGSGPT